MKENVIITASDKKYGDFLIDHWYRSLKENCDLSGIDIFVIDYGLSTAHKYYLTHNDINLFEGKKDGHVVINRFREMNTILSSYSYEQVLLCDSGDIIFQKDISPLFSQNKDQFRAVEEDIKSPFSVFIKDEFFPAHMKKMLTDCLLNHNMINAGFILGPYKKMKFLCEKMMEWVKTNKKFGPDQIVVNYVLHKEGFFRLEKGYNFVIATASDFIEIKNGVFYLSNGEIIPVVHNTGNINIFRVIENFGYGKDHNILKKDRYLALKTLNKSSDSFYKTQKEFHSRRKKISILLAKTINRLKKRFKKSKGIFNDELQKYIKGSSKNSFFGTKGSF